MDQGHGTEVPGELADLSHGAQGPGTLEDLGHGVVVDQWLMFLL